MQLHVRRLQGLNIESRPHPTPRCFCERVWNCLKIKELSFWQTQKSAEEDEKKGDRSKNGGRFEVWNVEEKEVNSSTLRVERDGAETQRRECRAERSR
jgi:hypothetical protein